MATRSASILRLMCLPALTLLAACSGGGSAPVEGPLSALAASVHEAMRKVEQQLPAAADRQALERSLIAGTNGWEALVKAVHLYSRLRDDHQVEQAAKEFGGWYNLLELGARDFMREGAKSSGNRAALRQLIDKTTPVAELISKAVRADTLLWLERREAAPSFADVMNLFTVLVWRSGALAHMNRHQEAVAEAKLLVALAWRSQSLNLTFVEHICQLRVVAAKNLAVLVSMGVAKTEELDWAVALPQQVQAQPHLIYLHDLAVTLERSHSFVQTLGEAGTDLGDHSDENRHAKILVNSLPRMCKLVIQLEKSEFDGRIPIKASRLLSLVNSTMNIGDPVLPNLSLSVEDAWIDSSMKLIVADLTSEAALAVIDFARHDARSVDRSVLARQVVSRRTGLGVDSFGGELSLVPVAGHPAVQFDPKWRLTLSLP